jgi:hypothetical protein
MRKNNDHAKRARQRRDTHKLRKAKARAGAREQFSVFFDRRTEQWKRNR